MTILSEVLSEAPAREGVTETRPPRTTSTGPGTSTRPRRTSSVDTDSSAPSAAVTPDQAPPPESTNARYGLLRRNRVSKYRCGTCGLRNCECNYMIQARFPIRPPGVLLTSENKPLPADGMVSRLVIRAGKTYTGLQRSVASYPLRHIFSKMKESAIAKASCPRFKI